MRLLVILAALLAVTAARATDLVVSVRTAAGAPVANAVVTVYAGAHTPPLSAARFDWPMRMVQQHLMFSPFVLIAPVGATVAFPNLDKVRHHVYSFSPPHPFELKLYGQDETRTVRFDKPGVVALGCNIHDQMIAFIKVVDTPLAARTGDDGEATLHDLPAEAVTLHVWHPYMRAPGNEQARVINLTGAAARQVLTVDVRSPPAMVMKY